MTRLRQFAGLIAIAAVFGSSALFNSFLGGRTGARGPDSVSPLAFRLVDVSEPSGLRNFHVYAPIDKKFDNVAAHNTAIGASVAVVDFDNDGWMDVFFANSAPSSPNRLFRNNRDGTFTDIADKVGLASVNGNVFATTRAIFFDSDNDGYKDLFLLSDCPRLYRNRAGRRFENVTGQSRFDCGTTYGGVNVIDFDQDGFLDLVVAPYYRGPSLDRKSTTLVMPDNLHNATNGAGISVYRNDGKGSFFPVPDLLGIQHRAWTHTVGVYDIRGSGRPDLLFSNDYAPDKLYLNEGGGRFRNVSESLVPNAFSRSGMNTEIGDVDEDGHPLIFISEIFFPGQKVYGNHLWKWIGDDRFEQIAQERGVFDCGWAWGAKFIDYDNDGRLDLFVGNGNVSQGAKEYWYSFSVLDSFSREMLQDSRNWPAMGDASLAGYQQSCVYLNQGNRFVNVVERTGVQGDLSDERGVALVDYMNEGTQSLVIANQKQWSKFYRNEQLNDHAWIGFRLVGTKSNRDAFGAKVTLKIPGRALARQLQPLNGYAAQSDDRIHFGLGKDPRIESVTIEWPSGTRQVLEPAGLKLKQYHTITEPRAK